MKALGIFKKSKKQKKILNLIIYLSGNKKDLGLPNLFPFKEQIIQSLSRKKEQKESEAKLKKLKNKKDFEIVDLENAAQRSLLFEKDYIETNKDNQYEEKDMANNDDPKEKRKYMKELRKVMEASDVIIYY